MSDELVVFEIFSQGAGVRMRRDIERAHIAGVTYHGAVDAIAKTMFQMSTEQQVPPACFDTRLRFALVLVRDVYAIHDPTDN